MDPNTTTPRRSPPPGDSDGGSASKNDVASTRLSGAPHLRFRANSKNTGSPQPSPLSQSTSAGDVTVDPAPVASEMDSQSQQPELSVSTTPVEPTEDTNDEALTNQGKSSPEAGTSKPGSMAAVMRGQEPDPIPEPTTSTFSGNNSPDARLEKDYHRDRTGETGIDSGADNRDSSGDEESDSRGRQKDREKKHYRKESNVSASDTEGTSTTEVSTSSAKKPPRKLKTFEPLREKQERAKAAAEPTVTITGPGGEKITVKKGPVHPNTNYDRTHSRGVSPNISDSEELRDIQHAQSLAIWASPIDNITPQRVIRTILRGDYRGIHDQAISKKRKLRTYFVATDISEEAAYALEWTIGTVLRDGDTLLAIYAVNEETGTGKTGDPERIEELELSEGAMAMRDTTATMEKMTSEAPQPPVSPSGSSALAAIGFGNRARRDSDRGSKDSRARTKGDTERLHAIDVISETCINFLRKTRLQVRVTVEVISCKSPRHMITEAIDYFEPTLVILGSRGRGALKGTLLGSFSNYLVAKSSIPVMVARKKLRGRKAKNVNPTVRLANNLIPTTDSRLTRARID
ncbi:MAG: hypothetical protein Q9219_001344 [cf. Caloplaca sp. 3 TL-2023]